MFYTSLICFEASNVWKYISFFLFLFHLDDTYDLIGSAHESPWKSLKEDEIKYQENLEHKIWEMDTNS